VIHIRRRIKLVALY